MGRVVSIDELQKELAARPGGRVVFTNGCFDIIHAGHLATLRRAASLGDTLVVGLNSDSSVARLKGPDRPFIGQEDRAELLAALEPVDYVVVFDEPDPEALIARIKPQVHVKGGDYAPEELPEADLVRSYGGEVVVADEIPGKSTSELIAKIRGGGGASAR